MQQALQTLLAIGQDALSPTLAAYARRLLDAFANEQEQEVMERVPPVISQSPRVSSQAAASSLPEPLTPREQEVLHMLTEGASNQEIARQLVVSLATVKKHVANILSKLGAENRT